MTGPETLVTVEFLPDGSGTRLVLTHENFATEDACKKHEDGWNRMTEALEEHCTRS